MRKFLKVLVPLVFVLTLSSGVVMAVGRRLIEVNLSYLSIDESNKNKVNFFRDFAYKSRKLCS
ncbi:MULTISPECIES: hypothetical protein [Candidatus Ichthyocystis]|uniref:hypothetical protein n=1 Tax=Candidatus Ichthyocystis TaxID=2929841 RepID=UPI001146ACA7|nr:MULTISPECIES: hypothetical protein [Ichthyocystis]